MGKLLYGSKIEIALDDRTAFHLDVLRNKLGDRPFTVHATMGGEHDYDLVSMNVAPGIPLVLTYANSPLLDLDLPFVHRRIVEVHEGRVVTIPFDFEGK
ncbi:hypothetical protein HMPREF1529_02672 [Microbacterium sp. oral taxon 186 str. F0373]|uniref:hypothetical protein n=1 Tax=Microbacterium sp. oral taxon 186 TaxID=712383 RepID=UPI00034EC4D4|nr:hypothetical protein [Microbacterium sp. oral taxon 186]EPD83296.1 hypothetical protein HMPREF1529_02672 [Microbacterium sp. oral taxon 186 str. F0373]